MSQPHTTQPDLAAPGTTIPDSAHQGKTAHRGKKTHHGQAPLSQASLDASKFSCIQPQAVIFDLDGTLLDTAPDIIAACNATLTHFKLPPLSEALARTKVTAGMREMLKLGVPDVKAYQDAIEGEMRDYFATYYTEHINVYTHPFPGIIELLQDLEKAQIKVAIVTNKYEHMAQELLQKYPFYEQLALILGCDSVTHSKPHPEPILKTLEHLQIQASQAIYVGDHLNDMLASNAAHTISAAALWGYGGNECGHPSSWHAQYLLPNVAALRALCLP